MGKQNVQTVKVANFEIPLADGWYAETQGTVASVFKNPKYEGAQITMSASSGVSASDLAAQSGQIAGVNAQVQTFDIKGKTYYGFETQNGFVLCIDGEDGLTLRIFGQSISLDQATPLAP